MSPARFKLERDELRAEVEAAEARVESLRERVQNDQKAVTKEIADELQKVATVALSDMEERLAQDLVTLDIDGLRKRIVQLVMQLQQRERSEAANILAILDESRQKSTSKALKSLRTSVVSWRSSMPQNCASLSTNSALASRRAGCALI